MNFIEISLNKPIHDKTLYLDKDGVINKTIYRKGKISSPRNTEEITFNPEIEYLNLIKRKLNFNLILISNQPDIARGYLSKNFLNIMIKKITFRIDFDKIFICPHLKTEICQCRKPKNQIFKYYRMKNKSCLKKEYFIGDQLTDNAAIKKLPITFVYYSQYHIPKLAMEYEQIKSFKKLYSILEKDW